MEHNIDCLVDDYCCVWTLVEFLNAMDGLSVDLVCVYINLVYFSVDSDYLFLVLEDGILCLICCLEEVGILIVGIYGWYWVALYLDVSDDDL